MSLINFHWCLFLLFGIGIKASVLRGIDSEGEDEVPIQPMQPGNWVLTILTYPISDAGKRNMYHGQANNGVPHGLGVLFYNQNDPGGRERYEGQFRNGFPNGIGVLYFRNGKNFEGRFLNGVLVSRVFDANKCKEFFDEEYAEEMKSTEPDAKNADLITYFSSKAPLNKWKSADKFCIKAGGKLAEITSSEQTKNINQFLNKKDPNNKNFYWIGLTDQKTEGKFVWTSTGKEAWYTNWHEDEPNVEKTNDEDCVFLQKSDRTWEDFSCSGVEIFALCEKVITKEELNSIMATTTEAATTTTLSLETSDSNRYFISTETFDEWHAAEKFCNDNVGKLAEIMTAEEAEEINYFLKYRNRDKFYWIGLTDQKVEGEFVWASNGSTTKYTNWESGEPNGDMIEDCVNLNFAWQQRTWNDISCYESGLFALCERELTLLESSSIMPPTSATTSASSFNVDITTSASTPTENT